MTTKKELRKRLDTHVYEITKLDEAIDETRANVDDLRKTVETHTRHIAEWRLLFEQIQTAVAGIREAAEAAVTREAARQNKIASVAAEVTGQVHNIAECFRAQSAADKREFSQINARLDNLEKNNNHDHQQQRRPAAETAAPTTTTTAPEEAKLPANARAKRPAARNRNRPPARTNPS